jgi:hypothetical protein
MSGLITFTLLVDGNPTGETFAAADTNPTADDSVTRTFEVYIDHPDWEWDGIVEHTPEEGHWVLLRTAIDAMDEDGRIAAEAVADRMDGAGDHARDIAVDRAEGVPL